MPIIIGEANIILWLNTATNRATKYLEYSFLSPIITIRALENARVALVERASEVLECARV